MGVVETGTGGSVVGGLVVGGSVGGGLVVGGSVVGGLVVGGSVVGGLVVGGSVVGGSVVGGCVVTGLVVAGGSVVGAPVEVASPGTRKGQIINDVRVVIDINLDDVSITAMMQDHYINYGASDRTPL